ncbi:molybdopterin-synthase adenylyltransferase MoeB [Portibacter lacus]|uniref:Molybdopterin-synthase adenylyltransferase n=1 Tax=Portibacter lacus TaxID=1099794 RepID=A0AA37SQ53_9BACT|nr:molybdopterin-synthase adenylyltransferase MoeB [Portibacter lacus]GLR17214.1 adenylyltransferase/sulfurtransferase MoeZ [Portibacter lacus]
MTASLTKDEFQRYSRHIILPDIGLEGQVKLKNAKVLVVGAGGLGVPVLIYLAAAGVGELCIVDFDHIDFSNLQRQVIYKTSEVGESKAETAKKFIHEQNPEVKVIIHNKWIDSSNALEIAEPYDIIVDGTDNFPTRYLLNDTAVILNKPYVYGSIFRFEGQVSVFNFRDGPNYRDLFPEPPAPELVPNCSEGGVLGVLPGIVGSIQSLETIKIIVGIGEILAGKLLTIDTLNNQYRTFKFGKRANRKPIEKLIDYQQFCNPISAPIDIEVITPLEMEQLRKDGAAFQLIDVREPYEYDIVHIGGSLMPKSEIDLHIKNIDRNKKVIIHCRSGKRSSDVIQHLKSAHGFTNLINLEGGLLRYAKDVNPELTIY